MSDSSDDEDLNKFREAADFQFINDSMFHKKTVSEQLSIEKPLSLRRTKDDDEQFNLFRVSPQFRKHVAKHLTTLMDKILQKQLTEVTNCDYIKPKRRKSGIKLLHNSPHYIKVSEESPKYKLKQEVALCEEEVSDEKLRSVAVSPDDILNQKETKYWSQRSKAPVYTYITTRNGLVLK